VPVNPLSDRIAINFLATRPHDFTYFIYRRELGQTEQSTVGMRYLPRVICLEVDKEVDEESRQRRRYDVSLSPIEGYERIRVPSYLESDLTNTLIHDALVKKCKGSDFANSVECEDKGFVKKITFTLKQHEPGVREIISARAYHLRVLGRFGLLIHFALRISPDASISDKRRLQLSLTHKQGRLNQDYYLDHYEKIDEFLTKYLSGIRHLTLQDGSVLEIEGKLSVLRSFTLSKRTFLFGKNAEGQSQFFGLRKDGPLEGAPGNGQLVFLFRSSDRAASQDLFRALRGDTYSTFPGMQQMFELPFDKGNVSGLEVNSFTNQEMHRVGQLIKARYNNRKVLPVALVPMSKHSSEEESTAYYAAKHAFLSQGMASQFIDRRRLQDRSALQWSISNIGLAIFAKLGGVPWKLKPSTERCLVVGIGQAHRVVNNAIQRYFAYSVLADSSGIYENIRMLGNTNDPNEYYADLKNNLRNVLLEHKTSYESFVIHLTFSMKKKEIQAIKELIDELKAPVGSPTQFVVLKFNDHNDFFGFSIEHNSRMPFESTVVPLSRKEFLLWFAGLGIDDSKIPKKPERPVHVSVLYPNEPISEPDLKRVLQDAVNISGANWRGFNAKSLPISIYYAKLIADYYAKFREAGFPEISLDNMSPWFL
jgi:hypothetical protein